MEYTKLKQELRKIIQDRIGYTRDYTDEEVWEMP